MLRRYLPSFPLRLSDVAQFARIGRLGRGLAGRGLRYLPPRLLGSWFRVVEVVTRRQECLVVGDLLLVDLHLLPAQVAASKVCRGVLADARLVIEVYADDAARANILQEFFFDFLVAQLVLLLSEHSGRPSYFLLLVRIVGVGLASGCEVPEGRSSVLEYDCVSQEYGWPVSE